MHATTCRLFGCLGCWKFLFFGFFVCICTSRKELRKRKRKKADAIDLKRANEAAAI